MSTSNAKVQAALVAAPRHLNPAIELWVELQQQTLLPAEDLVGLTARVERAIQEGEPEAKAVQQARHSLAGALPVPAPFLMPGF